jgi:hypothetical protein
MCGSVIELLTCVVLRMHVKEFIAWDLSDDKDTCSMRMAQEKQAWPTSGLRTLSHDACFRYSELTTDQGSLD